MSWTSLHRFRPFARAAHRWWLVELSLLTSFDRKRAIEAPRIRVHANLPRERFVFESLLEKPYPMSPGVLRSCRHSKWHASRSPRSRARVSNQRRKPMARAQPPNRQGRAHTVLFRERCDVRPERPKSYCKRRAKRPSARSKRRSDQERARNSHTSFTAAIVCVRVRQDLRTQPPLLASFDARTV